MVIIAVTCSVVLLVLAGAAVLVVAVLVGLRVRRWRKKESAAIDYYEDMGSGGVEVVVNPASGAVYEELQQSGLHSEHVYSTCKREGALDGVEVGAGGASRPDKQPTERVPGREQHYTALNMDTVNKSEYETLHKM